LKSFIDAHLRLVAQIVVNTRDDDDQPISNIRRLADDTRVIGRLARLDMADDHAAPVPVLLDLPIITSARDEIEAAGGSL
jgi:hypothetical protein